MGTRGHIDITAAATAILMLAATLIAIPGCQKDDSPVESAAVARAELDVQLSVDGGMSVSEEQTKSVVTGNTLDQSGRTYGIIACEHEDTPTDYKIYDADNANLYGNIQAWYGNFNSKGTGWWYSYESSASSRFNPLYFMAEDVSRHMDIYAYAPWKSGVTIQSGYQYNLTSLAEGDLPDLMYATYEGEGGTPTNRDITLVDKATIPLKINFHHALSRIAFHFKLANAQNTGLDGQHAMRLWQINLQRSAASTTPLYTRGTMDLLTGNVTYAGLSQLEQIVTYATENGNSSSALGTYDIYQDNAWKTFNMLVPPTEYLQDGDFSFRFYFNSSSFGQYFIQEYAIQRSYLRHSDGIYGFQPGYCYHFYFIIDNYIHLQNVLINTDWQLTDETEIKI